MATKKPKGLGRGLEALLGPTVYESPEPSADGLPHELALSELVAGTYQPRTRMDEGALYELAESIKSQGIMQPILVRRLSPTDAALRRASGASSQDPNHPGQTQALYEIIAGERRFRAARIAGLERVADFVVGGG